MLKYVSTSGTDQEQQEQYEKIHKWMCNAGGMTDNNIRGLLEYKAQVDFCAKNWHLAPNKAAKEKMLMGMWIATYEARYAQYIITIDKVIAEGNLVPLMPRVPPLVSGQKGLERLQSLIDIREVLKTRLEQYQWTLNTTKRDKIRHQYNVRKSHLLQVSYVFLEVCPERKHQLSSDIDNWVFSIKRVLASKDAHKAIFAQMDQVGMEMAALVAHVQRGPHPNIQAVLDYAAFLAARYANVPDDTALYYIGMITQISVDKLKMVFAVFGIEEQRTMEHWRLKPQCTEGDFKNAMARLSDNLTTSDMQSLYQYMVQNTQYA